MWASVGIMIVALFTSVTTVVVTLLNRDLRKHMRGEDGNVDLLVRIAGEIGVLSEKVGTMADKIEALEVVTDKIRL